MSDRKEVILEAACRVVGRRGVRGLRVEEIAREADVSVALIYYYFQGRADLLQRVLEHVNDRAGIYTEPDPDSGGTARQRLEDALLSEFQDDPAVIENVTVWSELTASAIFEAGLRDAVQRTGARWIDSVASLLRDGQAEGTIPREIDADLAAQRLTALVEGLSARWLIGAITADRAQELLRDAVALELGAVPYSGLQTRAAGAAGSLARARALDRPKR